MSNRDAFLSTISSSEGTFGRGDNGYNVLVGGKIFNGYQDHPRVKVWIDRLKQWSTAAGRYQILERIYDFYKDSLGLDDFSPSSQDAIAIQLIRERGALDDIDSGNFDAAVFKCSNTWASFPGNSYGQRQNNIDALRQSYIAAGGTLIGDENVASS